MNSKSNDKTINIYLKEIRKACPHNVRDRLIPELTDSVLSYAKDNPDATYEDIVKHFGTPQNFTIESLKSLEDKEFLQLANKTSFIKKTLAIIAAFIIIGLTITFIWMIIDNHQTHPVYYHTSIVDGTTSYVID